MLCGWGAPQLLEKVRYPSPPLLMRRRAALTGHHDLTRPDPLGFSCLVVLTRRYKTMYRWLHSGYMTPKNKKGLLLFFEQKTIIFTGGEGGIRTLGRVAPTPDFESGTFDHSATSPASMRFVETA